LEKSNLGFWKLSSNRENSLSKVTDRKKKVYCWNSKVEKRKFTVEIRTSKKKIHCYNSQLEKIKSLLLQLKSKKIKFIVQIRKSQKKDSLSKFESRKKENSLSKVESRKKENSLSKFESRENKIHCWDSQVENVEIRKVKIRTSKFAKSKFALRNSQSQNSHSEIRNNSHFEIWKQTEMFSQNVTVQVLYTPVNLNRPVFLTKLFCCCFRFATSFLKFFVSKIRRQKFFAQCEQWQDLLKQASDVLSFKHT